MKNTFKTIMALASVSILTVSCGVSESLQSLTGTSAMGLIGSDESSDSKDSESSSNEVSENENQRDCDEICDCNGEHKGKGHHNERPDMFADMDKDSDGFVTSEEWTVKHDEMKSEHDAKITGLDTNSDGIISAEELTAHTEKRTAEIAEKFTSLDTDKDGKISAEEFKAGQPEPKGKKMNKPEGKGRPEGKGKGKGDKGRR